MRFVSLCLQLYWFNLQNVLSCCLTQLKAIAQLGLKWQTVEGGAYFLFSVLLVVEITWQKSFPYIEGKVTNVWTTVPHNLKQCFLQVSTYFSTDILYGWISFYCACVPNQSSLDYPSFLGFMQHVYQDKLNFLKGMDIFNVFQRGVIYFLCLNEMYVICVIRFWCTTSVIRCIVWGLWVSVSACVCMSVYV